VKLPRDLSGLELTKALARLGYQLTRQSGSHIRLTTQRRGEHHITVPAHDPLKVGTLTALLRDVSGHFDMTRDEVLRELFP